MRRLRASSGSGPRPTGWRVRGSAGARLSGCAAAAAGAERIDLTAPFDVVAGDYVTLMAYDAAGNWQEALPFNAPILMADLETGRVRGYWGSAEGASLSMRVLDRDGQQKLSLSGLNFVGRESKFGTDFTISLVAGDRIDVWDKNHLDAPMLSMIVAELTARGCGDGHAHRAVGGRPAGGDRRTVGHLRDATLTLVGAVSRGGRRRQALRGAVRRRHAACRGAP